MGIWETITDLVEAATPWSTAEAEAPAQEEQVGHFLVTPPSIPPKPKLRIIISISALEGTITQSSL